MSSDMAVEPRSLELILEEAKNLDLAPRLVKWSGYDWQVEFEYSPGYSKLVKK